MEIAKEIGVRLVGIKNNGHFGIAAYFAMEALKEDMIGIALTQADARVAPFGARKAYIGTNSISFCPQKTSCNSGYGNKCNLYGKIIFRCE